MGMRDEIKKKTTEAGSALLPPRWGCHTRELIVPVSSAQAFGSRVLYPVPPVYSVLPEPANWEDWEYCEYWENWEKLGKSPNGATEKKNESEQ